MSIFLCWGSNMKRRLIITAVVGGLFFGGAGVALAADPQGLGPRPDGETGPRCAAALEHAGMQGVQDNDHRNTALENASANCKG